MNNLHIIAHSKIIRAQLIVAKDFHQIEWDAALEDDCRQIVCLAVREDLDRVHDWTTVALVPREATGKANVVARRAGVIAGLPAAELALGEMDASAHFKRCASDGDQITAGAVVATLEGPARTLLTAERLLLNLIGHLSGIATLTRKYVELVAGTKAAIYDTRKTMPGMRRLEKYAVRCGGGRNHRTGLFDAVLIKDNHLALGAQHGAGSSASARFSPGQAVERARAFLASVPGPPLGEMLIEVEVDSLEQLREVLPVRPDIVLLDNMTCKQLAEAVRLRDGSAPQVQLEASGGVNLETIAAIARTGIDRISVGALTHSAPWFDVGLDWIV